jgi:oxygen-dependent protoporphyrinogen oxidase
MSGPKRIAIIGGGVSGLAAAYRFRELHPEVELMLFEASNRLGGVIRTERIEGSCVEHGPDSLLTQVPWGLDLCRRIGIGNDILPTASKPQGVYVVSRGRLRRVPDGLALMAPQRLWPLVTSPILSLRGKLRLAYEYFIPPRESTSDESLAAFATRRLGREAFERLVQPLVSGIFMGSPDTLSVRATFPRFVEMEEKHGGLIRGARAQAGNRGQTTTNRAKHGGPAYGMFVAPCHGMEQITRTLADSLHAKSIRLRTAVEKILPLAGGRWRLLTRAVGCEPEVESFDGLIVASPAPAAARLLHDAAPPLAAELAAIDYTSCIVVNLAFSRDQIRHPLDAFGFVTPRIEHRQVTACTFSSVKYPGRAPEGWCLLRAYLGGATNPAAADWTDQRVRHAALDDLSQLLHIRGEPRFITIRRHRRAMPQYELGHLTRIDQIDRLVDRLPGFALAGNAYRGGGVAHCIHSGELAAERLANQLQEQQLADFVRS